MTTRIASTAHAIRPALRVALRISADAHLVHRTALAAGANDQTANRLAQEQAARGAGQALPGLILVYAIRLRARNRNARKATS